MSSKTLTDLNGLQLTCDSAEAVQLYNQVLESFCSQNEGFMQELKSAIALDPGFIMARCIMVSCQGYWYITMALLCSLHTDWFQSRIL